VHEDLCIHPAPTLPAHQPKGREHQPPSNPFVPGPQPEFAQDKWREMKGTKSLDFIRELLLVKSVRIDMVPGLPYFHHPHRFTFEDQKVKYQIVIRLSIGRYPIR
jgi:hypothetical protein